MIKGSSFWPWLLQRLSGLLLSAGVIIHFWMLHSSGTPTYDLVVARMSSSYWLSFYLFLLVLLIYHGFNGVWGVFLDFNTSPLSKTIFKSALYIIGMATFVAGVIVLGTLKP